MCSIMLIVALHMIDGSTFYNIEPVENKEAVTKQMNMLNHPALIAQLMEQGIMDVTVHEAVEIKPFKCK